MENQDPVFEQSKTSGEIHEQLRKLARELIATIRRQGERPFERFIEDGIVDLDVLSKLSYADLKEYDRPVFVLSEICRLLFKLGDNASLRYGLVLSHIIYAFKCKQNESWYISYLYKGIAQIGLGMTDIGSKNVIIGLAKHPKFSMVPVDRTLGYWALMSAAIRNRNLKLALNFATDWQGAARKGELEGEVFRSKMALLLFFLVSGNQASCVQRIKWLMKKVPAEWQETVNFLEAWVQAMGTGEYLEEIEFNEPYPLFLGIEWPPTKLRVKPILSEVEGSEASSRMFENEANKFPLTDFQTLCDIRRKFCHHISIDTLSTEEIEQYARYMAQWELPLPLNTFEKVLQQKHTETYFYSRLNRLLGKSILQHTLDNTDVHAHALMRDEAMLFVMDVRKYSALSEKYDPGQLFDILNPIFKIMHEELDPIGGTILEFVGDCIIVVFNVFEDRKADITEIVSGTVRCLQRIQVHNALSIHTGLPEIQTGVGIHKGLVALGYLGGLERCHLTVLGDTINVAARIETATKSLPANIVISAGCLDKTAPDFWSTPWEINFFCRDLGAEHQMKNISRPVRLFGLNPLIRSWVDFVPMGFRAQPEPGVVYLDAGNAVEPGIIDHHCAGTGAHCSCELLIRHPELLLDHMRDTPVSQLEFRFHDPPDLDCVASLYAAYELMDINPRHAMLEKLAAYMHEVNHAQVPQPERLSDSLYGVYKAHEMLAQKRYDPQLNNRLLLEAVMRIVDAACYLMEEQKEHGDFATIFQFRPQWFVEERELIEEDRAQYQEDLKLGSHSYTARVNGIPEPVTGIWLDHPQSLFFRLWAWNDPNAPDGQGYHFIALDVSQLDCNRILIGVNPDAGTDLKGLGELLEVHETQKRQQLGKERPAHSDPWYYGQGHRYGLIAAPGNGTVLTAEEIQQIHESWE